MSGPPRHVWFHRCTGLLVVLAVVFALSYSLFVHLRNH